MDGIIKPLDHLSKTHKFLFEGVSALRAHPELARTIIDKNLGPQSNVNIQGLIARIQFLPQSKVQEILDPRFPTSNLDLPDFNPETRVVVRAPLFELIASIYSFFRRVIHSLFA